MFLTKHIKKSYNRKSQKEIIYFLIIRLFLLHVNQAICMAWDLNHLLRVNPAKLCTIFPTCDAFFSDSDDFF